MTIVSQASDARVIYVGVPTRDEALAIGRLLVEERLAGAVNVVPEVTSIFWWDGAQRERSEATLLVFTLAANVEAAAARIQSLHSYVVPGIKVWTISEGSQEWLAWLRTEAQPEVKRDQVTAT